MIMTSAIPFTGSGALQLISLWSSHHRNPPVLLDVHLTTMPRKYSTVRFIRFKYCSLERTMLRVTTHSVSGHVLLKASLMLSWKLEYGTSLLCSAVFFVRRSLRESSFTLKNK